MAVTYYVALPFVRTEEGVAPGQAQEMPNEPAAIRRAESMSRDPANAGALAFKRVGGSLPGLMRSIAMPSLSHQTESLERLNKALGLAKGTPLSDRMADGRPRSANSCWKAVNARSSRVDSRASHSSRKREA